jgi:UDP-2,3-diacylglucosamine pyrophosphatase LpxH
MIAVISDLHFEEEASDVIPRQSGLPGLIFRRNLDPRAYCNFIAQMAEQMKRRRLRTFDLVIAGDLFDFNRTVLWFKDELRPYIPLSKVTPPLEAKLLNILEAIAKEPPVQQSLEALRLLAKGRYRLDKSQGGKELDFPAKQINIHYLTGNHDRLSNATRKVRRRVRELIGLKGDAPFEHAYLSKDPAVLVRHGHEYDGNNFSLDAEKLKSIPTEFPDKIYDEANFGDFMTIDVAARLPYLLRRKYGDHQILADKVMSNLYLRLLQFDDVRPQSALIDYMLDTSHGNYSAEEAWERVVPVLEQLLDEIHKNAFFNYWLARRAKPWTPAELEAARSLLKVGGWRNKAAREAARKIGHYLMGGDVAGPEILAQREKLIQKKKVRMVVAGHTHHPQVCLLGSDPESDRFYVNTGTWRNRIPATPEDRTFGRLQALTCLMLFSSAEDRKEGKEDTFGTFDYWTGYTRHWRRRK